MAHASFARSSQPDASEAPSEARPLFLKPDRPRAIDQHIDFFGGATATEDDACGEAFLEELA